MSEQFWKCVRCGEKIDKVEKPEAWGRRNHKCKESTAKAYRAVCLKNVEVGSAECGVERDEPPEDVKEAALDQWMKDQGVRFKGLDRLCDKAKRAGASEADMHKAIARGLKKRKVRERSRE